MIYLFEDREGRMKRFLKGDIESHLLKRAVLNCRKEELSDYIGEHFSDAELILFHLSYVFPQSGVTNDSVREVFLSRGIPFIYFSGQSKNSIGRTSEGIQTADVRSEDMYSHLPAFIQVYKETGKVNIPLLVFGEHYLMNSLLKVLEWTNNQLWELKDDEPLKPAKVLLLITGISTRMQEDELKADKDALIEFINGHRSTGDLTPVLLLGQIQRILDRH